jgi:hypothetical protein
MLCKRFQDIQSNRRMAAAAMGIRKRSTALAVARQTDWRAFVVQNLNIFAEMRDRALAIDTDRR